MREIQRITNWVKRYPLTILFLIWGSLTFIRHFNLGNEHIRSDNIAGGILLIFVLMLFGFGLDYLKNKRRYIVLGLICILLFGSVYLLYYWGAKSFGRSVSEQLAASSNLKTFMDGCTQEGSVTIEQCRCFYNELYERKVFSKELSESQIKIFFENYLDSPDGSSIFDKCIPDTPEES